MAMKIYLDEEMEYRDEEENEMYSSRIRMEK